MKPKSWYCYEEGETAIGGLGCATPLDVRGRRSKSVRRRIGFVTEAREPQAETTVTRRRRRGDK